MESEGIAMASVPSSEGIVMEGTTHLVLYGESGNIKEERHWHNLVVSTGKDWVAQYLSSGTPPANMGYMALGTGTESVTVDDTALGAEVARTAVTRSTPSPATSRYWASFGPGVGTGAITEAGIFNADTSGTMLSRQVFGVINKGPNDTLEITWDITFN